MTVASKMKDLTGPSHTDRFGIGGTDLGVTVTAPDGRLVSVFGDTFDKAGVGGPGWRSPVVLFGDPASVSSGITWTGAAGSGNYAQQILAYQHDSIIHGYPITTMLPTDVITIGEQMYLHVMACEGVGTVHWTELYSSSDNGQTWSPTGARWPGDYHNGLFQILTFERGDDGYVYVFSTGFQRDKGLVLQRVPTEHFTEPTAWQTWERQTLIHGTSWDTEDHTQGRVAQPYGGYLVPGSTLTDLHLIVSQWNTTTNWPYHAMQFHANLTT